MERTCDQIRYLPRFYWGCCHHRKLTLSQPGWGKWYKINWLTTFTVNTANHSQSQSTEGLWLVQSDLLGSCSLYGLPWVKAGEGKRAGHKKLEPSKVSTKYLYGSTKTFLLAVLLGSTSQCIVTRKYRARAALTVNAIWLHQGSAAF